MRGAYEQVSYKKLRNCINNNKSKKREINFNVNHKAITYFPVAGKENCKFKTNYCSKIITGSIFPQYHKILRTLECRLVVFLPRETIHLPIQNWADCFSLLNKMK